MVFCQAGPYNVEILRDMMTAKIGPAIKGGVLCSGMLSALGWSAVKPRMLQ